MSTSSPSSSEPEVPLPPDPRWQKPKPIAQHGQEKPVSKKLALLATLVILALVGCANITSPAAFWTSIQSERIEGPGQRTSYNPHNLSAQLTQPIFVKDRTAAPPIAKLLLVRNVSISAVLPPPEPTSALKPTLPLLAFASIPQLQRRLPPSGY